jgi:hypothetical protein
MTEPTKVRVVCPECDGLGWQVRCENCYGEGTIHATMLDTASGPVVIGDEAWAEFEYRIENRDNYGTADILTALFPDGIEVAEAVGHTATLEFEDGLVFLDTGNPDEDMADITGRRVALLGQVHAALPKEAK